jgi:ATP-dependent helicase/nuclease subunit A
MVWKVASEHQPEVMKTALAELVAAQSAENERLFYVVVTRAEVWLIIVAAGDVGEHGDSWHQTAHQALTELRAVDLITPVGVGLRLQHMDWQAGQVVSPKIETQGTVQIPDWAQAKITPIDRPPATLAPSQLGGAKVIWQPGARTNDEDAKRLGTMVHRLLDVLPAMPRAQWQDTAQRMFAVGDAMATPDEIYDALADATRVMDAPDLQHIFAKDVLSEVDISASLPDLNGQRVAGAIDRLMITRDLVLAIDFKTNVVVPARAEDTPDGLLRQMGAYQAALEPIFPDRRVETAILWTRVPSLMMLPNDIVRAALRATAIS